MARKGLWTGTISFGLLNIPVSLRTAEEEKELHFQMLDSRDYSPIKMKRVNANRGTEVPYERIVRGFEYKPDQFVVIGKEDFLAANPKAAQAIDLETFVDLQELDPMFFQKPYYVVPQKGGEKGYFLLRDALSRTGKVAIGKIVLHNKQHLVALMSRGEYLILEILRFAHTVLEAHEADYLKEVRQAPKYSVRELQTAEELIRSMTSAWEPNQYRDTYFDDLMKRIESKIRLGKGQLVEKAQEPVEKIKPTKVADLLPLLRKSLDRRQSKPRQRRAKPKEPRAVTH